MECILLLFRTKKLDQLVHVFGFNQVSVYSNGWRGNLEICLCIFIGTTLEYTQPITNIWSLNSGQIVCDKVCQWLVACRWFYHGTTVSSTNKTDRHDILSNWYIVGSGIKHHNPHQKNPKHMEIKVQCFIG